MIDVNHQVNAVRRAIGTRVLDAGEAHVVTLGQSYPTDAADLWDALTNIERIPRWFLPVTGELRVGGQYQLEGNANGTVLSCDPPSAFTATWEFGGNISWIEVRVVEEEPNRARFELQHIAEVDDDTWQQYGPGAVGIGWDLGLVGLSIHLQTGQAIEPGFEEQWSASDEGRHFVKECAAQWHRATVASGADPEWARSVADRCAAFYLGEPQN
ncbi:SRPBCC family protein [Mycolicibacterium sp. XJ870]